MTFFKETLSCMETLKVFHPGSNKQNVPPALAMFDEATVAIQSYFLNTQVLQNFYSCLKSGG